MAMTVGEQAYVQAIIQQRDAALAAAASLSGQIAEMRARHAEEVAALKKEPKGKFKPKAVAPAPAAKKPGAK